MKRPERASEGIVEGRILLEKRRRAAAGMDASRKRTVGVRFNSTKEKDEGCPVLLSKSSFPSLGSRIS
jgi:hypothetical protein